MAAERFNPEQIAVISYADQKIGAWNQIQLMASQWGVQCYRVNSPDMLKTVLREVADFECVLIDTSGVDIARHHAEVSQYASEALIHLVVATEISRSSTDRLFKEGLAWDSVNVTKLDESSDAWILLDALASNQIYNFGYSQSRAREPSSQTHEHGKVDCKYHYVCGH